MGIKNFDWKFLRVKNDSEITLYKIKQFFLRKKFVFKINQQNLIIKWNFLNILLQINSFSWIFPTLNKDGKSKNCLQRFRIIRQKFELLNSVLKIAIIWYTFFTNTKQKNDTNEKMISFFLIYTKPQKNLFVKCGKFTIFIIRKFQV